MRNLFFLLSGVAVFSGLAGRILGYSRRERFPRVSGQRLMVVHLSCAKGGLAVRQENSVISWTFCLWRMSGRVAQEGFDRCS